MAKRCEAEYLEVSAKTGLNVKKMFRALPIKQEAMKNEFASKTANYSTNVVSMARKRPERECCNIF